ncbi:hypothetical protein NG798_08755 [Ancylothrix sp. C2]|uniref:hypothetical protein n=1 Tax=Ancylothrix sp. D3o TaxID=2953691 RepID=UPI0021BA45FE|nr:hypothetical protein [Ancylothrix sp. D3o]MCT7949875.1 hypothetical protein [Ancylothrix sp. D3o]
MQKQYNLVLKIALTLTTLILTTIKPAIAQTGNQSDSTGPIPTTSDIAGGPPTTQTQGGTETVFQGGVSVQTAVNQAAATVISELSANTLTGTGTPIPAATQQTVLSLLTDTNSTQAAANITTALTSCPKSPSVPAGQQLTPCPGSPPVAVAQELTSRLAGLLTEGKVSPEQLKAAIRAYNAMILASNTEFLSNPPAELNAIRISLSRLIAATGRS